jgi:serine/threonine protein kinase
MCDHSFDHYKIRGVLGSGAYATVWDAVRSGSEDTTPYAIKVFDAERHQRREATAAANMIRIAPGRTVTIVDTGSCVIKGGSEEESDSTTVYYTTFLREETDLDKMDQIDLDDAPRILQYLLETLDMIHKAGFIHSDIKPANIMVSGGIPKLGDLESINPLEGHAAQWVGTPDYAVPEAYVENIRIGSDGVDNSVQFTPYTTSIDMWALALTLWRIVFGFDLFNEESGIKSIASGIVDADTTPSASAESDGESSGSSESDSPSCPMCCDGDSDGSGEDSDESDHIPGLEESYGILCNMEAIMGPPPKDILSTGYYWGREHAAIRGVSLEEVLLYNAVDIEDPEIAVRLPNILDFIARCLKWDPAERMTVAEALEHPLVARLHIPMAAL